MAASLAQVPVNQKFVIYLDDESDYIIQGMADKKYLITHGSTLSEAVQEMADLIVLDSKRPREADKSEGSLPAGFVVPELQQAVGGEKRITVMENIAMTDKARWSQAKIAKYKKYPSWMRVAMVLFCFPFMLFFWVAQDGEAIIDSFSEQ